MDETPTQLDIKLTNQLNGEIIEKTVKTPYEAEQLYISIDATEKAAKKAKDMLMRFLDEWLGEDKEYAFPDGKRLKRSEGRETRTWTVEGLKAVGFDEDAISVLVKVDMTTAKSMIDEYIEKGIVKPNAKKELNESADVKVSKASIQLR